MRLPSLLFRALLGLAAVAAFTGIVPLITPAAALAENNGAGSTPVMGWTTWDFVGRDPTAAKVEAQATAMRRTGLVAAGYRYINIDDFWYNCPRGGAGPDVDAYGRWVADAREFPSRGRINGIKAVANYVHARGEKFGIYVTPGISRQAVAKNTRILGTRYRARQIVNGKTEKNYNCWGMEGINYRKPGAQAFIDSWADEFAAWGVDYVKLDGVGAADVADVRAWSAALRRTGRTIHLELSNNLPMADHATWARYSNGWRTGGDVACYCGGSYPLTRWDKVDLRFAQAAQWQPYGGPGGFNDLDAIEVGNGWHDGITAPERQSQLSLWAMAASPLILGSDLTRLTATDLGYLKNSAVIAVDQDAIDARRIVNSGASQVFAKTEQNGDVIIGLFNASGTATTTDTVDLAQAGITGAATATNLWTGASIGTISGSYSVRLGPGAVELLRAVRTIPAS